MTKRWAIPILLFVVALSVRLYGIADVAPQPDEIHWTSRTRIVLEAVREGKWYEATSHIGHPGVSPALVMGVGQWLGNRWNQLLGVNPPQRWSLDRTASSRIAAATVSSALVPFVYLIGAAVFNPVVGGLAGILISLDPRSIGYSTQAHLDSIIGVFVLLTCLFYFLAVERSSLRLKYLSGVFWGFSLLGKPTVLGLLPAFFLYKFARRYIGPQPRPPEQAVVVSDVGAVFIAHVVFALLFTRLWKHESPYLGRLRVRVELADTLYNTGLFLQSHPLILVAIASSIFILARYLLREKGVVFVRRYFTNEFVQLLLMLGVFVVSLGIFPQVIENIVRFWGWVFNLRDEGHVAYGRAVSPPPFGYLGILSGELTIPVILGLVLLPLGIFREKDLKNSSAGALLIYLLLIISCTVGLLSVSGKQTSRYLMPLYPALILVSAWGINQGIQFVYQKFSWRKNSWISVSVGAVVLFLAIQVYSWRGAQALYFNTAGALEIARDSGRAGHVVGIDDLVELLHNGDLNITSPISVFGDIHVVKRAYRRHFGDDNWRVSFTPNPVLSPGMYAIVFPSARERFGLRLAKHKLITQERFVYKVQGVELLWLYQLIPAN